MVEQVKSMDFNQWKIKFIEKAPLETMCEVLGIPVFPSHLFSKEFLDRCVVWA
jgi:hypothetical protein